MTDTAVSPSAGASPASSPAPALEVTDVVAGYGHATVLRGVSLTVPSGSVVALLGPNGAGKSTLLKTVSGLVRPTSGSVRLFGDDGGNLPPNKRARRGLCHIPEGRGVYKRLTVRENLQMQADKGDDGALDRAVEAFPRLGERVGQLAGTLSGGEQQMLSIARAYTRKQRLILVDEASLGLAPIIVNEIFEFLTRIVSEQGTSLLIVDQFVHRALEMATTAYILRRGEIVFDGPSAGLRDGDMFSRYLGGD